MIRLLVITLLIATAISAEEPNPAVETGAETKPEGSPDSESVDANIEVDEAGYDDMAPDEMLGEEDYDYDHDFDYGEGDGLDSVEYDAPEAEAANAAEEKPAAETTPAADATTATEKPAVAAK